MKIINLIEDTASNCDFLYEHGLCFYIETEHHRLLCDTGASNAFIKNAQKKGIDIYAVDTVVISHGHYDHAGGVLEFARLNKKAKIYIHKNAVGDFYNLKNGQTKYIGMNKDILSLEQVVWVEGNLYIDNELSLVSEVGGKRLIPGGNSVLNKRFGGAFLCDDFDHEQYLVISEGDCHVLISGCAHRGILNILDAFRNIYGKYPTYVISGFHTTKPEYEAEDEMLISKTAQELSKMDTVFYSGHCTGEHPMQIMQSIMGEQLKAIHSGDEFVFGKENI